ncbi:hypothetical protein UY3_19180 [Chelonia mydas]|uniref:Uncharacterized protein n=1 Tax=Chelonia mydas TaxID=8469 RepID=M7AVE0_CHEMY|nr:hypothetical protein UY3_19180 [Chelonia mydas]
MTNLASYSSGSQSRSAACSEKAPGAPDRFVYLKPRDVMVALPSAPIGLERRTAASGSCDRLTLRMRQGLKIRPAAMATAAAEHTVLSMAKCTDQVQG